MDAVAFQFMQEAGDEEDAIEGTTPNSSLSQEQRCQKNAGSHAEKTIDHEGSSISFAIECGAFVLHHKMRRMEWRRGCEHSRCTDSTTIETEKQKWSFSHTLFGHRECLEFEGRVLTVMIS